MCVIQRRAGRFGEEKNFCPHQERSPLSPNP